MIPNLYESYGLSRAAGVKELAAELSEIDCELQNEGKGPADPQRRACEVAYGILSNEANRELYDDALDRRQNYTWEDLRYLSSFGKFPTSEERKAQPNSYGVRPTTTFATAPNSAVNSPSQFTSNYSMPLSPLPSSREIPSPAERRKVRIFDFILSFCLAAMMGIAGADVSDGFSWILSVAFYFLYMVCTEAWWGGTPVKLLYDMRVEKYATGENLTIKEAARRNLWNLMNMVPGIGIIVAFFWGLNVSGSMGDDPEGRGKHDREVDAIVVKKKK